MRNFLLRVLFCASFAWSASAATPPQRTIHLEPGQQLAVPLEQRLARVAIGDDTIVDAQPLRGEGQQSAVLLRARGYGRTQLLLWTRLDAAPMAWDIEVAGTAGDLRIEGQGRRAVLTGQSADLAAHERAVVRAEAGSARGATAGAAQAPVDQSVVQLPNTVQVDVKVVEFNRTDLKEAGINLTASTSRGSFSFGLDSELAPVGAAFDLAAAIVNRGNFNLNARLRLMEENGVVRVLAEPSLVAVSGQTASFLAGGEVPIPVPSGLGTTSIEYKSFGIGLRMTPTVLAADRIALKVAPEASDLDYSNAVTISGVSVPAISTRRTETMVELGDGESFVIGGLVSRTTESSVQKVPLLGDLPVLGPFFKSMSHSSKERELLIVVTPHLVRPLARGTVLPATPGEAQEKPAQAWQDYVLGPHATDTSLPGFSK